MTNLEILKNKLISRGFTLQPNKIVEEPQLDSFYNESSQIQITFCVYAHSAGELDFIYINSYKLHQEINFKVDSDYFAQFEDQIINAIDFLTNLKGN